MTATQTQPKASTNVRVRALEPGPTQTRWYMGPEYMVRIGQADARRLAGMYPLPHMGHEIVVAIKPDPVWPGMWLRAYVQNISGSYWLASPDTRRSEWPTVFGIEVN